MRTFWVLILFGSLIIHHCFTTTAGEAIPSTKDKEAQPSFSDCKPYVDAALKGDLPPESDDQSIEESVSTENQATPPDDESSEDDEPHQHQDPSESSEEEEEEEDVEEPEINGLEIDDDDVEEVAKDSTSPTTKPEEEEESSEEVDQVPPPQNPPPTQAKAEEQPSSEQDKDAQSEEESDENDVRKGTESHSTPTTTQHHRASGNTLVKDTHDTDSSRGHDVPAGKHKDVKDKKATNTAKETKSEVKNTDEIPVEVNDPDAKEQEIVKKTAKPKKQESKPKKVELKDDDDSAEKIPTEPIKPKKEESKVKNKPVEDEDDDDSIETVKEPITKPKKVESKSKKVQVDKEDDDSDESQETEPTPAKTATKTSKVTKTKDEDDSEETAPKLVKSPTKKEPSKKLHTKDDDDDIPPIVKKSTKPKKVIDHDSEEEEEIDTKIKSPPTKVKSSKVVATEPDSEESGESQEEEATPAPPLTKKSKVKDSPTKVKSSKVVATEPDSEESGESQEEATPAPPVTKKSKVKDSPKKIVVDEDKDDDDDDDDDYQVKKDYEPRPRDNIIRLLGLKDTTDFKQKNALLDKVTQQTLKELKNTYEYSIKPLETLYKYRDLSNRHFGDPEIFSKPMIVFMGPWSGGKSTIINWLLGIQDDAHALRTGADPSPAQFNILSYGNEEEVLDGTQLAADWTFSGLQKFGQSFLDRLRGRKLPNRLLERVNLVEIPGILEIRKQVERSFPFNDACQWFIDRADVLFLVYDPAKLDIGPETEAILDQLKGRESQVRIVLNKADTVKPDELLRVQATLIWNISPLMASAEPPVLYVASLWDHPLQPDAPASLLNAHETLFLKDINDATLKRVETRIAAARRFAVRVRNHAKMVDCYLNTYNNHRSFFSNKKRISDDIIEHPQNYHIYEGLSTLTNISRYDLPDPDSYRDFFRLNPVWEFPTLSSTCTYFRGCPINKLDVAIAYDLPELLGRYRRQRESIVSAPTEHLPEIKITEVKEKKEAPIDIPKGKARWYKLPPEEQKSADTEEVVTSIKKAPLSHAPPAPPLKAEPPTKQGKNKWWKEVPETEPQATKPASSSTTDPPPKPKNKWWKEVVEVVKKQEEVKGQDKKVEHVKKAKKEAEVVKKLTPKEGFNIIQPTNKWYRPYYEPIKRKEAQPQEPESKKNKWYKSKS